MIRNSVICNLIDGRDMHRLPATFSMPSIIHPIKVIPELTELKSYSSKPRHIIRESMYKKYHTLKLHIFSRRVIVVFKLYHCFQLITSDLNLNRILNRELKIFEPKDPWI